MLRIYKRDIRTRGHGFSVIEVLVVVVIISILGVITYATFFDTNRLQALEKDRDTIVAMIERARSLTISSSLGRQYGVHLATDRVILFPGSSYDSLNSENKVEMFHTLVSLASTSLVGGGSDVVFERLTGKTSKSGTLSIALKADPSRSYIITIFPTGIVERE